MTVATAAEQVGRRDDTHRQIYSERIRDVSGHVMYNARLRQMVSGEW